MAADPTSARPSREPRAAGTVEPPQPVRPPVDLSGRQVGRIPVLDVTPRVDDGRWPARAVVGEAVPVEATVFREGHDAVAAYAVLTAPDGREAARVRMHELAPGSDRFGAWVVPDATGDWTFHVEGASDVWATWEHAATVKVAAGVDVEVMLAEGVPVLQRAAALAEAAGDRPAAEVCHDAVAALQDPARPVEARLAPGVGPEVHAVVDRYPVLDLVTASAPLRLRVERERALFSAWYEFFPRSEGAHYDEENRQWVSGTLRTAAERLPAVAAMGFDFIYMPPIHPIGRINRKGRNNTLDPQPGDPGSPWAIGAAEGGHDAIHPDLGDEDDFAYFVSRAKEVGLEVALDFALQCAPDHPWATDHPEWFTTRVDGSIAYAENPPKKYQDIYPVNFDNDPEGIYAESLRLLELWISRGVTVFRVDNPHTKTVEFWEWLIGRVNAEHPEVIFLAEAFTRPQMMRTLGKVGFQQSYTYFTWRTSKQELTDYVTELATVSAHYMRPSFWPSTPDILHAFLQYGGPAAHRLRAVLAATLVPSWGIYAAYELGEHVARPGAEEYIDNEKYEYRPRDWAAAEREGRSLAPLLTRLNEIRKEHPALQRLRGIVFHQTEDDAVIAYSRHVPAEHSPTGKADTVLTVVNLDPHAARETMVHVDTTTLGLPPHASYVVHDLLSGQSYSWAGSNYVRLDPYHATAHVFAVRAH
ncbi:alpha-1,4-glucan--maltose-1-phosphate maltosyltransferase [Aquipuribacter nitratireducens]|uniref:Alpha-1,4-glucan:maltose-1-phosphate maltosyltransferase n=1 Tax=Aquipuribacter nitratireducens TaxID=650104 RepID=A0ABW0GKW5_9MICO